MKFARLLPAISLASVVALALGGCTTIETLYRAYGPESTPTPAPTRSFAPSGVVVLKLGDCLDQAKLEDGDIATDPKISCTEPHDLQVYAHFLLVGDEYPSVATIVSDAAVRCGRYFTQFVGVDFGISALDFVYYYPTESSWAAGDRTVDCAIFDPDGKVTGTLKYANR